MVGVRDGGVDEGGGEDPGVLTSAAGLAAEAVYHMQATKWVQRVISTMNLSRCSSTVLEDSKQAEVTILPMVPFRKLSMEDWRSWYA